jgi:hypothetical protein
MYNVHVHVYMYKVRIYTDTCTSLAASLRYHIYMQRAYMNVCICTIISAPMNGVEDYWAGKAMAALIVNAAFSSQ